MTKRLLSVALTLGLFFATSISWAGVDLSFFLGMKDGSENSDGVTVTFIVEEGANATEVFNEHWADQQWSDQFVVDLTRWGGKTIELKLTTDPGEARNTGWDWILIGDTKVTADGSLVYDIGQAVADGQASLSMVFDGEDNETDGLSNGANCSPDVGPSGGQEKPKSFMQHVPWDGKVGNTISRYEMTLPAVDTTAVKSFGKLTTTWGHLRTH